MVNFIKTLYNNIVIFMVNFIKTLYNNIKTLYNNIVILLSSKPKNGVLHFIQIKWSNFIVYLKKLDVVKQYYVNSEYVSKYISKPKKWETYTIYAFLGLAYIKYMLLAYSENIPKEFFDPNLLKIIFAAQKISFIGLAASTFSTGTRNIEEMLNSEFRQNFPQQLSGTFPALLLGGGAPILKTAAKICTTCLAGTITADMVFTNTYGVSPARVAGELHSGRITRAEAWDIVTNPSKHTAPAFPKISKLPEPEIPSLGKKK